MYNELISKILWETEAVKISLQEPFKLVSGNYSPIYIDCRKLISFPHAMQIITTSFCNLLYENEIKFDIIAGGESAGIPFAAFLAKELNKPMVYVRKKTKEHGTKSLIEGDPGKNNKIILIEDLITDGRSKLGFIQSLQESGNLVYDCLVVFDRQQGGADYIFREEKVDIWFLCGLYQLICWLEKSKKLSQDEMKNLKRYIDDSKAWNLEHGFSWMGG